MSNKIKELFLQKTKEENIVFSTGFRDLDNCIKNVKTGSLITIGGRPAMGKTELTLSIVNHLIKNNKKVTYFNLYMSENYFINRLVANKTNLPIKDIFEKQIELSSIISDLDFYENNNLEIINEYNLTIDKLEQKIKNSEIVVIDYIQLIKSDNPEIDIIQELKRITIEKNIIIIVLSQISRKVEGRNNKYPLLADLKTFDSLEELSDVVLMIYRDDYYNRDSSVMPYAQIIIQKNLYGEREYINLNYKNGHFASLEPIFTDTTKNDACSLYNGNEQGD
ncbi:DnaB-like helicase C-terminal domain-containing protein [bacterium]|nr:DnaB-like helicase C-terminal domain-containing protein [bacterium]